MPDKPKIGVIGLGIMGRGIAQNFLKNGYPVCVWNRTESKATDLQRLGARIFTTPAEVTKNVDILFEVVADDQASRSVWLGNEGILSAANPKQTLIVSSSLSVAWTNELSQLCQRKDLKFLDIPLTGSRKGAENGTLTLLAGGDEQVLNNMRPVLGAISERIFYFGPTPNGMRFKLILNSMQAVQIIALKEALQMAKISGLDLKKVGNVLTETGPGSPTTKLAWTGFQKAPDPENFAVRLIEKDLGYAKEMAADLPTPLLDLARQTFTEAKNRRLADKDWTSIFKA